MAKEQPNQLQTTEQTSTQVSTSWSGRQLSNPLPATYATYRTLRKHPTLALGRAMITAPILASEWSVQGDDPDQVELIANTMQPLRDLIVEKSMYGGMDFGWMPFEQIFGVKKGAVTVVKMKPLLHDITTILIDEVNGAFAGFRQASALTSQQDLLNPYCLNVYFREEGTNWYGYALLENARKTWNEWNAASDAANKYDKKIAGSRFVIYFPPGETKGADGTTKANDTIALELLNALEAGDSLAVPNTVARYIEELNNSKLGWVVDTLEDKSSRQPGFVARQKYLDALLIRSLLFPERAILEGEFGTKAEAGVHLDMAITNLEMEHRRITRFVNWYCVDTILAINFGENTRGMVELIAAPLVDEKLNLFKEIYLQILKDPSGFALEASKIDLDAMKEALGVPIAEGDPLLPVIPGMTDEDRDGID